MSTKKSEYTKGKIEAIGNIVSFIGVPLATCHNNITKPNENCAEANATELVRRWNSHEALLEACEASLTIWDILPQDTEVGLNQAQRLIEVRNKLKAAIAAAKE